MLDQQYFGNKQYHPFLNEHFIVVHAVNGEEAGEALYELYDIHATPTTLILTADGSEIDRVVGFGDPDGFQENLIEGFQGENNYLNLYTRYQKNPKDILSAFLLAEKYQRRYSMEWAEKSLELYKSVLKRPEEARGISVPASVDPEKRSVYEHAKFNLAEATMYTLSLIHI